MEYIRSFVSRSLALPRRILIAATIASAVLQAVAQTVLNDFYARSLYPVPYYVGQTSFDADQLEGWYGAMDATGTLGIYWQTQLVDFGFVAATALLHYWLLVLVARLLPDGHWRRLALALVVVGVLAPVFDALENLVSFVALADPTSISPFVAIVYSSFASLKFLCFVGVYLWTLVGLVAATALWIRRGAAEAPR